MEFSNAETTMKNEALNKIAEKKMKTIEFIIGLQINRGGLDLDKAREISLNVSTIISTVGEFQSTDENSVWQFVRNQLSGLNLETALESYLSYEIKNIFKSQFLPPQVN